MMSQRYDGGEGVRSVGASSCGSNMFGTSAQAPPRGINLQVFDDSVAPSKEQWERVEDLIKILDRTDKEGSGTYSKMSEHLEAKDNQTGSRMMAELEDFVTVRESLHSVFMILWKTCFWQTSNYNLIGSRTEAS